MCCGCGRDRWLGSLFYFLSVKEGANKREMLAFGLKDRSPGVTMLVNNIPTVAALLTLPMGVVLSTGWRKEVLGEVPGSLSVL